MGQNTPIRTPYMIILAEMQILIFFPRSDDPKKGVALPRWLKLGLNAKITPGIDSVGQNTPIRTPYMIILAEMQIFIFFPRSDDPKKGVAPKKWSPNTVEH